MSSVRDAAASDRAAKVGGTGTGTSQSVFQS